MTGYNNYFDLLNPQDIEEKIMVNKRDWGYDLFNLKKNLERELAIHYRLMIRYKAKFYMAPFWKKPFIYNKFSGDCLMCEIQMCNLREQISYINNKIYEEQKCQPVTQVQ